MSDGFTKLFSSIITSSIWAENDDTRIVWITMLALADEDGFVSASIVGLANCARKSIEETDAALKKLAAPDEYSRTTEHDGRRIEKIDGGWLILNYITYRDRARIEGRKEYIRQYMRDKRKQSKLTGVNTELTGVNPSASASASSLTEGSVRETTLDDCLAAAEGIGLRRVQVEKFWRHYASVGFLDPQGRKIVNLKAALAKWKANDAERKAEKGMADHSIDAETAKEMIHRG